jgi:Uma2 family endonuclease
MLDTNDLEYLPSSEELPDSDDTPVDNEIQNLIPNLLKMVLGFLWPDRYDYFFGVDMGIYDREGQRTRTPIIPDGFLSLGVPRLTGERGRLSYVISEENDVIPFLVLEVVSQNYGGEYDKKMQIYANLGVLYYVIYNSHHWKRRKREPLEVYRLEDGVYVRLLGNPVWIEEIKLGIGVERGIYEGWERNWLYWYNQAGKRYEIPEEMIENFQQQLQEQQQLAEAERQKREELENLLKEYQRRFGHL